MDFVFDIDKAVAAAAYVTKRCGKTISSFLLIKILYGADRNALAIWHRPITGDSFVSMKKGPVLSRIYDLIKGAVPNTNSDMVKWSKYFSPRKSNYDIDLIAEPNLRFLSQRETEVLEKSAQHISVLIKKHGLIADVLHAEWPEWKDPASCGRGAVPIMLEEVLGEVIDDESEIEKIVQEIKAVSSAKAALQISPV